MRVSILGTDYEIIKRKYDDDERFREKNYDGYCEGLTKRIVHCDMTTYPGWDKESPEAIVAAEKQTLRHEIVHAFFDESGLQDNGNVFSESWAVNEEMVDWFAIQGPKIYEAWRAVGAL